MPPIFGIDLSVILAFVVIQAQEVAGSGAEGLLQWVCQMEAR